MKNSVWQSISYYFISHILIKKKKKSVSPLFPQYVPKELIKSFWLGCVKKRNKQTMFCYTPFFHRSQMTQISKEQISISCSCELIGPMEELSRTRKSSWVTSGIHRETEQKSIPKRKTNPLIHLLMKNLFIQRVPGGSFAPCSYVSDINTPRNTNPVA